MTNARPNALSRIAGRLVTGPLAFLVAWVLDVAVLLGRWVVGRFSSR